MLEQAYYPSDLGGSDGWHEMLTILLASILGGEVLYESAEALVVDYQQKLL